MVRTGRVFVAALALAVPLLALVVARADSPRPLSEADVLKLVELQVSDQCIVARVEKAGVCFKVDDAVIERLKKAGASETVLASLRKVAAASPDEQSAVKPKAPDVGAAVVELGRLEKRPVFTVAVSPDGKFVAVGGEGENVAVWNLTTGQRLANLSGHPRAVFSLKFSPDGKILAAGCHRHVLLWDVDTWKAKVKTLKGHSDDVTYLNFAPDSSRLVTADNHDVVIWDMRKEEVWRKLDGFYEPWSSISPDSQTLVLWGVEGGFSSAWSLRYPTQGYERLAAFPGLSCGSFSPDGMMFAAGRGKDVLLFDTKSWRVVAEFKAHTEKVSAVSFSADGKTLCSSSADRMLLLFDVANKKERFTLRGDKFHWGIFPFRSNVLLTWGEKDPKLMAWDPATAKELGLTPINWGEVERSSPVAGGRILAVVIKDKVVKAYNLNKILRKYEEQPSRGP